MNYAKRVNAVKVGFLLFVNSKSKKEERTISGETDYQNVLTITAYVTSVMSHNTWNFICLVQKPIIIVSMYR